MKASVPAMEALPRHFPIFPLTGALLLPHGRLPLNIFEPRYVAMIEDALASGRHIGMIQPNPAEPRGATGPALHRVGCIGRVVSFAETEDGRFLITLHGVCRFAVAEELPMQRGYRRVRGNFALYEDDITIPPDMPQGLDRDKLLAALRLYFLRHEIEANWEAIDSMSDTDLVATLAMGCPFPALEKQALLEAPDFADRADTLLALLHIGQHGDSDPSSRPS